MNKILGLVWFSIAVDIVAMFLPANVAVWVALLASVIVIAGLGSIVLSQIFGGDGFDHLFAGFALATPGCLLMNLVFGWKTLDPITVCLPNTQSSATCGIAGMIGVMLMNLVIIGIGMAIIAIPVLPVMWNIHKSKG